MDFWAPCDPLFKLDFTNSEQKNKTQTYGRGPYPFACHARDPMLLQKKLNSDAFSIRILEERSCMTCLDNVRSKAIKRIDQNSWFYELAFIEGERP